jgi:phenylalanyl-tRNA synthetase beta chain
MKISLDWVSDFVPLPASRSSLELAEQLTLATVEVEGVETIDGDTVFEIDNKSLTNRPDLWGHYGIAREFAAILGLPLAPLPAAVLPPATTGLVGPDLDPALCARFSLVEFTVDNTRPTPEKIRRRLAHIGQSTVNLMVDLSNYVMFTVGQPNHVWDADAVALPMTAAMSTEEIDLPLVAGPAVHLSAPTPVIRDREQILGLAGIMGGDTSSVRADSHRFLLETATFDAKAIRRGCQQLGLRTEASARYDKGLDTQRVDAAIAMFLHLLADADPSFTVHRFQDVTAAATTTIEVRVERTFLDRRIGVRLAAEEITATLSALGFGVTVDDDVDGDVVEVVVPTWRATGDVALPHDILEELARIHGYDQLPSADIPIVLKPVTDVNTAPLDRRLREELAWRGGLQEVLTYPWVRDEALAATGVAKADTTRFLGATAPDHDSLRPALLPNLLEAISANLRYRDEVGIFEIGSVFRPAIKQPTADEAAAPQVTRHLGLAVVTPQDGGTAFRLAKGHLEDLREHCHLEVDLDGATDQPWADRSARLGIRVRGHQVGALALLPPRLLRYADIQDVQIAYAELDLGPLTAARSRDGIYHAVPDLPQSDFDLSVLLANDVPWSHAQTVVAGTDTLIHAVNYIGEYRSADLGPDVRSLTLRVTLQPRTSTLSREQIDAIRADIIDALRTELAATLRD